MVLFFVVKEFFYISLLLGILKEIAIQKTDSDEVTVLFDLVQEVFQKMLECVAWTFRKQPEESLQVLFFNWPGLTVLSAVGIEWWLDASPKGKHACILWWHADLQS